MNTASLSLRCVTLWLAASVLVLAAAGCGRGSLVGRKVDDFRAYYNTFYNAENTFEEATASLDEMNGAVDPEAYLSVFPGPEHVTSPEALDPVVEKGADVLREHPGSKWIDDALMLIGTSYFYQRNYVGAERKFHEVLGRESGRASEARFWLARTLVTAGRHEEAAAQIEEGLRAEREVGGRARLHLVRGELAVQQQQWPEAASALTSGLAGELDRRTRARAAFLLGQVYETIEAYDRAAAAYAQSAGAGARYELTIAARLGALRAEGHSGEAVAALRTLEHLERDDKHADKRAEMALLRGQLYRMRGQSAQARRALTTLLHGEEPAPPAVQGRAHYALGVLYRDAYQDYQRAAAHFDSAATRISAPQSGPQQRPVQATPVAATDSRTQAERFTRVAVASRRVERLDSLLYLGSLDEAAFRRFVEELRRERAAQIEEALAERRENAPETGFGQGGTGGFESGDGQPIAAEAATSETGFLYHRDPVRVQEGRAAFIRRWGTRPLAPNWRRSAAVSGASGVAARGEPQQQALLEDGALAALNLPEIDLTEVPRDTAAQAAMRAERADARYELANALFLTLSRPDSAITWYERILLEDAESAVARRARYALAEAHRALGRTPVAHTLYRQILRTAPDTPLGRQARARLLEDLLGSDMASSTELRELEELEAGTDAARAEERYVQAYDAWQRGDHAQALQLFVHLAAVYPSTKAAPRALLAAGTAALEWNERREQPPYAALPITAPDSLTREGGLLYVPPSPPEAVAPEAAAPDSGRAAPDDSLSAFSVLPASSGILPDSVRLQSDSLAPLGRARAFDLEKRSTVEDWLRALPEAPRSRQRRDGLRVEQLLAGLVARYPEAPEADRAQPVLDFLRERAAQAAPEPPSASDVLIAVGPAPDSLVAPTLPAAQRFDGAGREWSPRNAAAERGVVTDSLLMARAEERRLRTRGDNASTLYGAAVVPEQGGWTIVVASEPTRAEAERRAERYGALGYRTGVIAAQVEGQTWHRVGVGQFATRATADAMRSELGAVLPGEAWLLDLAAE